MKDTYRKLHGIKTKIEGIVERRGITFEERTERWQESQKGDVFLERSEDLRDLLENLGEAEDQAKDYIDKYHSKPSAKY